MSPSLRVLFVHGGRTGFVERDLRYFERRTAVSELQVKSVRDAWAQVVEGCRKCDVVYCWFAGRHAILPILVAAALRKPIVLVAGGYDVASEPEINYGTMRPGPKRTVAKALLRMSDIVVSVSNVNQAELLANVSLPSSKRRLIPHGFADTRHSEAPSAKLRRVITVGEVDYSTLRRKGLETFAKASRGIPEIEWVIVGRIRDETHETLRRLGGQNLTIAGYVSREHLIEIMRSSKVYAQLSFHEAFGCGLAEAMIEECVPVVTDRGSIPEVAGPFGVYVPYGDSAATVEAVRQALDMPGSYGAQCRDHILTQYSEGRWTESMDGLLRDMTELANGSNCIGRAGRS